MDREKVGLDDERMSTLNETKDCRIATAFDLGMQFRDMITGSCHDGRDVQRLLTACEFQGVGAMPSAVDPSAPLGKAAVQAKGEILRAIMGSPCEPSKFENLSGIKDLDGRIKSELAAAGIDPVSLPGSAKTSGEVKSRLMGELGGWLFERYWTYWVASGPGLPPPYCDDLHDKVGEFCRVDGDCTAPSPSERFRGLGVNKYHVDTPEALRALVESLNKAMGLTTAP